MRIKCGYCGKEFEKSNKHRKYCSEICAKEMFRIKAKDWRESCGKKPVDPDIYRPSKAFEIEAEMRKSGLSYADYQRKKTLEMIAKENK